MLAEAVPGLAKQTRLSAPSSPALCLQNLAMHLWLELREERDSGEHQCLEPTWLLPTHCHPRTSWPLLPQGKARFTLQKPEAAKIETWTDQRLQKTDCFVCLLFPPQTRKGMAGEYAVDGGCMCVGRVVRWFLDSRPDKGARDWALFRKPVTRASLG